jgi:hypothetical protein
MEPTSLRRLFSESEGKGLIGCMLSIVLLGILIFVSITLIPIYYSNYNLEADLKTEVSRAGAHFIDDESVVKDIIALGRRNEIRLTTENVKVERFAGQIHISVRYAVPVDFLVFQRDLNFKMDVSSFMGAL